MKTIKNSKIQKSMFAVVMGILMIALFTPLLQAAGLSVVEKDHLLLMREEEKTRQRCLSGAEREVEP